MQPTILRIPLAHLVASGAHPLTREGVIDLSRCTNEGMAREVYIVVTVGHEDDGLAIEIATVELNSAPDGGWRLQYVSHPAQSGGLTASIVPCASDFVAFIRVHEMMRMPRALTPLCAQELEDKGLGPLAALNLRCGNSAPVVPSKAALDKLVALAEMGQRLDAGTSQSSKNGPRSSREAQTSHLEAPAVRRRTTRQLGQPWQDAPIPPVPADGWLVRPMLAPC